jgi:hypothetical protein
MTEQADIRKMSQKLRSQTCALLGLDPNALSLAQQLRVNRASALRLQIDDLEAAQLRGQSIDINKLVEASEALERLVGGNPEAAARPDFSGAKELAQLFAQRAAAVERRERVELTRLAAENARLLEENTRLTAKLNAAPQPAPPNNVVPIDGTARANATRPPERYLRDGQPREPWRDYVEGARAGALIAPAWSPPDHRR